MMQPLVGWMRVVLPRGDVLSVAVVGVVLIETIYGLCLLQNWGPDPVEFGKFRLWLLGLCSLVYGVQRAVWFHPALHVDYRRWLELTPWVPGRSLPAGPILLVAQDLVAVAILIALQHELSPDLLVLPVLFLFGYLVTMAAINRLIGEWALAYAVAFGLASIPLLQPRWEYVLALELACYLPTAWAIQRGLRRFPWKLPEVLESRSFKSAAEAVKDRLLGWPYDALKFDVPKLFIPRSDGICLSFLAGWLELSVLLSLPEHDRFGVLLIVGQALLVSPICIAAGYLENHRSPISFWGRVWTLRWIIPSFDRVWIVPITAGGIALAGHILLPLHLKPLAFTGYLLIVLVLGPNRDRWRLTGKHRLTFGWHPSTMAAKDFIEI